MARMLAIKSKDLAYCRCTHMRLYHFVGGCKPPKHYTYEKGGKCSCKKFKRGGNG